MILSAGLRLRGRVERKGDPVRDAGVREWSAKRILRKTAIGLGVFAIALAGLLLVRTVSLSSQQVAAEPALPIDLDARAISERLGAAIRIPTLSLQQADERDDSAFRSLHSYLARSYPRVHSALGREVVSDHALLYTWAGSDPLLEPLVLLAHQDVVPVEPGTESSWQHPPFSGALADGYVWGRGALDNKGSLIALLEATEVLLAERFQPRRTVLLAFGHDEELGGPQGAAAVSHLLQERGIRPAFVLDEGGSMVQGMVSGVAEPMALVGIAEKGYVSAELVVETAGGHSATPRPESSIGILVDAIARLQANRLPARVTPPVRALFDAIAPEATFGLRLVISNLWLFEPIAIRVLDSKPEIAALLRTTTAPTILEAGMKENVIPGRARAVVNFRILPGESIESVLEHVRATVADDRVHVSALPKRREPSPTSPTRSESYPLLARTIREVFPGTVVAPFLMLGGSDARHFASTSEDVYRFTPLLLSETDIAGIHGTDERVSTQALTKAVRFYVRLLRNAAGSRLAAKVSLEETDAGVGDM
jgi:carboxypeptidase PM20D1